VGHGGANEKPRRPKEGPTGAGGGSGPGPSGRRVRFRETHIPKMCPQRDPTPPPSDPAPPPRDG